LLGSYPLYSTTVGYGAPPESNGGLGKTTLAESVVPSRVWMKLNPSWSVCPS
jgi:hypothetical protein